AYLASLTDALLEKLALYKRGISDPLTGLSIRDHFEEELSREIELIQSCLLPGGDAEVPAVPGSVGLIILDLDKLQWINESFGYALGDEIAVEVGRVIRRACPEHMPAARLGHDSFGVLIPDAGGSMCFQVAEEIRNRIAKLSFEDSVTGTTIRLTASLGHACYPQNMYGPELRRSPSEQARILMRKGAKAVVTAKVHGRDRVFAYGDILQKGGTVIETLPMNRLALNLGTGVGARVGQRFLIRTPRPTREVQAMLTEDERLTGQYPSMYKGEVVLVEVQQDMAFAELLHLGDPAWPANPGDQLELISENESLFEADSCTAPGQKDMVTGLYTYRDFITRFTKERGTHDRFCLTILKVMDTPKERRGNFQKFMDAQTRRVAELVEQRLGKEAMGGNFGLGGLIYYLPERTGPEVGALMQEVVEQAASRLKIDLAAGAAAYPNMTFTRDDMIDNVRKALDHAMLLDPPRSAVFDSISLNVAADRLYMEGDIYNAIEEFKLSLLADETNGLARNSLGICYAQLGRLEQARHQFEQVILHEPEDLMAHFNLGWTSQLLGDTGMARTAYEHCLKLDPVHVFTLVRLARLVEKEGDLVQAEKLFNEAAQLPGGEPLAMRHLSRLAVLRNDFDGARECLHLALQANHNDAYSLHLLAKLYLDQGEDPQIAEVLARQAAALAPTRDEYWDLLVRALEEQDKFDEAEKAAGRKMTG
ncbi:MAG: diguanylate cyclase, partial [Proteobacteria bacterium]|nr:diguanylate cyclase [Pseudomonadota bacterium]MBU1612694.1 diguanylate cyclase [Pseudomonadota bacterium]